MARLLTYKDGRLRTGRVALIIFICVLAGLSMVFKLSRPVDQALVSVRHVFEPQESARTESEEPAVDKMKHDSGREITEDASSKEKAAHEVQAEENKTEPREEQKTEPLSNDGIENRKSTDTAQAADPVEPDITPIERPASGNSEETPVKAAEIKVPEKTEAVADENEPERKKTSENRLDVSEKMASLTGWKEQPDTHKEVDLAAGLEKMASLNDAKRKGTENGAGTKVKSKKAEAVKQDANRPEVNTAPGTIAPLEVDRAAMAVTVDPQQYMALFQSWKVSGQAREKDSPNIPLRVENLRNAYELFQMKAVAVTGNGRFIDLSDGGRIPEAALESYSGTVFRVDKPWTKWGDAMSKAGIRQGEKVELRYYMYGFIRDAIYARVERCFRYCMERGLIPRDTERDRVDVLGRAYVIRRQGGGRFGVFVPVSLDLADGRTISINPECFNGQPDVEVLRTAGIL